MKKNLILGSGKGYSWYMFEPYVRSFAKNVANTDLVLFVEVSDFTRTMFQKLNAEVKGGEIVLMPFPNFEHGYIVNNRWKLFLKYIEEHESEYEQIFITDVRDLIYQGDIFKCFAEQKNFLGYATEEDSIRGRKIEGKNTTFLLNYFWHKRCFGKEVADKLADKDIICCGTVIGTLNEMKIFLNKMIEFNPDFNPEGDDQATQQYLVYNNLLPVENLIKIDCWTGEIFTSFLFHEYNPIEIKDNFILRGDGKIPAVVHQYDRHPSLVALVDKIYRDPDDISEKSFIDVKTSLEQMSYLINCEKFDRALNIFVKYLLNKEELATFADDLIESWENLVQKNKNCLSVEILNTDLQCMIKKVLDDKFYIRHGKSLCKCLEYCKANDYTLIVGFEDWVHESSLKAVNWHLTKNNVDIYPRCLSLLIDMKLTDNKIFCILLAEMFHNSGKPWLAAEYYEKGIFYDDEPLFEKFKIVLEYWQKLSEENNEFYRKKN